MPCLILPGHVTILVIASWQPKECKCCPGTNTRLKYMHFVHQSNLVFLIFKPFNAVFPVAARSGVRISAASFLLKRLSPSASCCFTATERSNWRRCWSFRFEQRRLWSSEDIRHGSDAAGRGCRSVYQPGRSGKDAAAVAGP